MDKHKIGDWLIDIHTKQVFKIINIRLVAGNFWYYDEYKLDTGLTLTTKELNNNYNKIDMNCPVAQLLYMDNSNKAVTNETNEK